MTSALKGKRVLLVEDEVLLMMSLNDMVEDLGCVASRAMSVELAIQMARDTAMDIAILDINLSGQRVTPVAEILSLRGVPFIVTSGYDVDMIPSFNERLRLRKPYSAQQIRDAMIFALAPG